MITQSELKALLDYNPDTGIFTWKVNKRGPAKVGMIAGARLNEYTRVKINGKSYYAHNLAWLYVYGNFPDLEIDHIYGVKNDNRIKELRKSTHSQNISNSRGRKGRKKWAYRHREKWEASVRHNGEDYYCGLYDTELEAHEAGWIFAQAAFGLFARKE